MGMHGLARCTPRSSSAMLHEKCRTTTYVQRSASGNPWRAWTL